MSDTDKKLSDDVILNNLLEALEISGKELAKVLGFKSHATIYHIKNKRNSISNDLINRIVKKFPQVNYFYLKKGEEPILVPKKLARNQFNVLFPEQSEYFTNPSYDEESFLVLKSIDHKLGMIVNLLSGQLETKKADNQ